jgi:hypothetical protein
MVRGRRRLRGVVTMMTTTMTTTTMMMIENMMLVAPRHRGKEGRWQEKEEMGEGITTTAE